MLSFKPTFSLSPYMHWSFLIPKPNSASSRPQMRCMELTERDIVVASLLPAVQYLKQFFYLESVLFLLLNGEYMAAIRGKWK